MSSEYTAAQIAQAMGAAKTTILRRLEKEGCHYTVSSNRTKLFDFQTLPSDIQKILMQQKYTTPDMTPQEPFDRLKAEELADHFKINIPPEKLKDPKVRGKIKMVVQCLAISERAENRTGQIQEIAKSYGYNKASAYRLMARVKKGQSIVAATKNHGYHIDDLNITLRAWDEKAADMAIRIIMGNKRRHQDGLTLYTIIKDTAEAEHWRVGTYASFMQLKKKIKPALKIYRDKGRQGLRQDVIPGIRRDATAYRAMECLIGDQHKADYYAIDSSGKVATLELFCWMDFRTQLVWGAVSYKHYNKFTAGQALTNAVRWGMPQTCYTDWGKPEKSNYMTALMEQLIGIGISTEAIEHLKATQRHPQAKPIEGFFGILDRRIKNAQIPGYCKRLKDPRENELQQKQLNQLIKAKRLLSVAELTDELIKNQLMGATGWNEHKFKARDRAPEDNGKSPIDIYVEEVKQYPVSSPGDDMLEYIFLPQRECLIKRSSVSFRHEYFGKQVYYHRDLADYQGTWAMVRYYPFDPREVWIFDKEKGKLICRADSWDMVNPKITEQVEAKRAEQKALSNQIREIYQKYAPPTKPVRRINRHEREAKQLSNITELRVMRTSLEKEQNGKLLCVVNDPLAEFRKQFHPGAKKKTEEKEYKPLFALSMKDNYEED